MKIRYVVIALAAVAVFSVSAFGQPAAPTCDTAKPVGVPSNTPGDTTTSGTAYGPLGDCLDEYGDPGRFATGGQWVQVVGTGNTMTADLCAKEKENTDAAMVVICNQCAGPMCVGASEDLCGSAGYSPQVSWCSIAGQTYWIGVGDNFAPQGAINIDITDDGTPCDTARSCTPVCGNGVVEGKEVCESKADCPEGFQCGAPGAANECECYSAIPMLPAWGLVGLGVLLVAGGATVFGRRRA